MPTYEYRCSTCGGRFEIIESITADARTTCPEAECVSESPEDRGRGEVSRVVSGGAGVLFKGDGFYVTDYVRKGESGGSESGASTSGDGGEASSSTASSDTTSSPSGSDSTTE